MLPWENQRPSWFSSRGAAYSFSGCWAPLSVLLGELHFFAWKLAAKSQRLHSVVRQRAGLGLLSSFFGCAGKDSEVSMCPLLQGHSIWPSQRAVPWWFSWLRICLHCRRLGFNTCVRKIPWRRAWHPTPVFLPREVHGQRSLAGCRQWSPKRRIWLND